MPSTTQMLGWWSHSAPPRQCGPRRSWQITTSEGRSAALDRAIVAHRPGGGQLHRRRSGARIDQELRLVMCLLQRLVEAERLVAICSLILKIQVSAPVASSV
ncbi:MAG: hypothetical protein R3F54_30005 [Alphaproteobacteria bacterium]